MFISGVLFYQTAENSPFPSSFFITLLTLASYVPMFSAHLRQQTTVTAKESRFSRLLLMRIRDRIYVLLNQYHSSIIQKDSQKYQSNISLYLSALLHLMHVQYSSACCIGLWLQLNFVRNNAK